MNKKYKLKTAYEKNKKIKHINKFVSIGVLAFLGMGITQTTNINKREIVHAGNNNAAIAASQTCTNAAGLVKVNGVQIQDQYGQRQNNNNHRWTQVVNFFGSHDYSHQVNDCPGDIAGWTPPSGQTKPYNPGDVIEIQKNQGGPVATWIVSEDILVGSDQYLYLIDPSKYFVPPQFNKLGIYPPGQQPTTTPGQTATVTPSTQKVSIKFFDMSIGQFFPASQFPDIKVDAPNAGGTNKPDLNAIKAQLPSDVAARVAQIRPTTVGGTWEVWIRAAPVRNGIHVNLVENASSQKPQNAQLPDLWLPLITSDTILPSMATSELIKMGNKNIRITDANNTVSANRSGVPATVTLHYDWVYPVNYVDKNGNKAPVVGYTDCSSSTTFNYKVGEPVTSMTSNAHEWVVIAPPTFDPVKQEWNVTVEKQVKLNFTGPNTSTLKPVFVPMPNNNVTPTNAPTIASIASSISLPPNTMIKQITYNPQTYTWDVTTGPTQVPVLMQNKSITVLQGLTIPTLTADAPNSVTNPTNIPTIPSIQAQVPAQIIIENVILNQTGNGWIASYHWEFPSVYIDKTQELTTNTPIPVENGNVNYTNNIHVGDAVPDNPGYFVAMPPRFDSTNKRWIIPVERRVQLHFVGPNAANVPTQWVSAPDDINTPTNKPSISSINVPSDSYVKQITFNAQAQTWDVTIDDKTHNIQIVAQNDNNTATPVSNTFANRLKDELVFYDDGVTQRVTWSPGSILQQYVDVWLEPNKDSNGNYQVTFKFKDANGNLDIERFRQLYQNIGQITAYENTTQQVQTFAHGDVCVVK